MFLLCGLFKLMSCKYFPVSSNLGWIGFEYFFWKKTLHVEGNKILKANLKCTCRFTRLFNLDTVGVMSGTNRELQIWNEFEYENDFKQCLLIIQYKTPQLKGSYNLEELLCQ